MTNTHRTSAVACYLLAAALMVFYLFTLWQGLHPTTSSEYRAFYLEQKLLFWPGKDGLDVAPGQTLDFTTNEIGPEFGAGHLSRDEWRLADSGWQATSDSASVFLTASNDVVLQARLQLRGEEGQELILTVGDSQDTVRTVLTGGIDELTFTCAFSAGELLELTLETSPGNPITIQELTFL